MENKEIKEHQQIFTLARVDTEQINEGVGSTGFFYKKVGYAICEKCGLIIKQDI